MTPCFVHVVAATCAVDVVAPTWSTHLDVATLHPADRKLHEAAYEVLSEMRKPLMAANIDPAERYGPQPPVEQSAVLTRGAALLDAVRGDLKRAMP